MREIKFRAWDRSAKRMYHVADMSFGSEGCLIVRTTDGNVFTGLKNAKEYELMQYTGLKDKNGKEIYEGDIFKWHNNTFLVVFKTPSFLYHKIYDSWLKKNVFERNEESWLSPVDCERYEVIGNKWDNPELLKEVE